MSLAAASSSGDLGSFEERRRASNEAGRDAVLAGSLLLVDPHGLGGIWVYARRGGGVEEWRSGLEDCAASLGPVRRIPASVSEGRLLGGLDLASTLASGAPRYQGGLLSEADGGLVVVRDLCGLPPKVAALLACALDLGRVQVEREGFTRSDAARFGVVAFDEGEETRHPALRERLGLALTLEASLRGCPPFPSPADLGAARALLPSIETDDTILEGLTAAALAMGIGSARAPMFALRAARAAAALEGRDSVSVEDVQVAARFVLLPRATMMPIESEEQQEPPLPPPPNEAETPEGGDDDLSPEQLADLIVEAVRSALPEHLLEELRSTSSAHSGHSQGRAGAQQKTKTHGRKARSRRGQVRDGAPLDVLDTIRAAAPFQTLRRNERAAAGLDLSGRSNRLDVRASDFRIKTFKAHRETAAIFVVDASGSSALNRLAEAKGAIELLLADCYARRDHVALIAFRGQQAQVLLPPTRSLSRVKRSLAALPGGGGTPLATATNAAAELAKAALRKGQTPAIVFLTDGKANIDRKGQASRERAEADALEEARALRAQGISAIVIDTSPRPGSQSRRFASDMGARYLALPYANAHTIVGAVRQEVQSVRPAGERS